MFLWRVLDLNLIFFLPLLSILWPYTNAVQAPRVYVMCVLLRDDDDDMHVSLVL